MIAILAMVFSSPVSRFSFVGLSPAAFKAAFTLRRALPSIPARQSLFHLPACIGACQ